MPKVSIVVPVYNVEKYLDRCVASLQNQTLEDIEIILVDDGSPDKCPQLCDEYARQDRRIHVVHKQNAGLGMACNSGLEIAKGEYIAFCDSDDWVDSDMYRSLYEVATAEKAQMVFSGLKRVDGSKRILGYLPHRKTKEIYSGGEIFNLLVDMVASSPCEGKDRTIQMSAKVVLYNRKFLNDNNIKFVSERIYPSEDLIFNVSALIHADKVVVVPDFWYNYFVNPKSISMTVNPHHYKNMLRTVELLRSTIEAKYRYPFDKDELQLRLARLCLGEARSHCGRIARARIPYKQKKQLLKDLRKDVLGIDSIKRYPFAKMPKKHYVMHQMIIHQCHALLILLLSKLN